jgi:hypothetical protein
MTGECEICGAPLGAHNITRLCAECKLVARNRRLSPTYDEPSTAVRIRRIEGKAMSVSAAVSLNFSSIPMYLSPFISKRSGSRPFPCFGGETCCTTEKTGCRARCS